jgi:hypothetical protein
MAQFRFIGDPRANGHGPSPQILFGLTFSRDEWTDVPADLIEKAATHSHLERRPEKAKEPKAEVIVTEGDAVVARGAKAKADGKGRTVPPAYRGKPEEARWLAGWDGV